MIPSDIRDKLDRKNFEPFRLFVSDGASYDITQAGNALVVRAELIIGLDPDVSGVPTKAIYVDSHHVTRIEPLTSVKAQRDPRT